MVSTVLAVHVVSTGLQLVLGLMLLRRPKEPVVAVLAHLFLVNGTISLLYMLNFLGIEVVGISGRLHHQAAILEAATNILILWLALCYPKPVRWMPPMPAVTAPILAFGLAILADAATGGGIGRLRGGVPLDAWDAFWIYGLFDLVFAVLLLRWTHHWLQPMETARREQFMLLFAAFGMRATHLSTLVPALEFGRMANRELTDGALILIATMGVLILVVGVVCLARILMQGSRLPGEHDTLHLVVTVFLFIGVAEGMLNATINVWGDVNWWRAITLRYDVMIARPAMVWLAFGVLHQGGVAALRRNQAALGSFAGLGIATIVWIAFPYAYVVGGLAIGVVGGIIVAMLTPSWLQRLTIWQGTALKPESPVAAQCSPSSAKA